MRTEKSTRRMALKIVAVWLVIFVLASFTFSLRSISGPVTATVLPQVPKQGEPVIATFNIKNPSPESSIVEYQLYANGKQILSTSMRLAPESSDYFQYAYKNPLQLGEQVTFLLRVASEDGEYEESISRPPYPPQIWSSFVSFASFSTSSMGFMSTMSYYESSFSTDNGVASVGVTVALVLIALLIFLELTIPQLSKKTATIIGSLRVRFSKFSVILFIIFMGMVFTTAVLVITS